MKKNIILLVAMSLTLSGCGIYTKYKPATSVPDDLYGGEVVTEDTAGLGNMDWRELFTDPHLQSLIETGLRTNTDYQSAQLCVEEAQAVLMSAKLAFLPAFALSPQGTVSSFDTNKATQGYSLPVTASWELDVFGRMRNSKKQAKALYAQSEDYRQAVRTQLIAGIANTYYTLLMLDEQLIISRQTEEAWKETVASTRSLMNAGLANESAVSQMEATYYQVQGSVLDLQQQINQVENSLALLLAETPRNYERGTTVSYGLCRRNPCPDACRPPRCPLGRADAGSSVLWHQCGTFGFLPFHHVERKCRMDELRRVYDSQSGQVPGIGGRFAHAAAL